MRACENYSRIGRAGRLILLLGMMLVATFAACGKKGPLYLPEEANAPRPAASPAAVPPVAGTDEDAHQK
ncbi:MAG TPA: lipoprotein [Candidatus Methylomirabilis sp.]|nr:lipoprotein [Candidatus Methylomirabilis sp.]